MITPQVCVEWGVDNHMARLRWERKGKSPKTRNPNKVAGGEKPHSRLICASRLHIFSFVAVGKKKKTERKRERECVCVCMCRKASKVWVFSSFYVGEGRGRGREKGRYRRQLTLKRWKPFRRISTKVWNRNSPLLYFIQHDTCSASLTACPTCPFQMLNFCFERSVKSSPSLE